MAKRVITYGTFDCLHYGHVRLLQRAKAMGDYLIVGLSTDDFNAEKGKTSEFDYEQRFDDLKGVGCISLIVPEKSWAQKGEDIRNFGIDVLVMGDDWEGKFDYLRKYCEVVYLPRTPGISTTLIKGAL